MGYTHLLLPDRLSIPLEKKFAYCAGFMYDDMRKKFLINKLQIKKLQKVILLHEYLLYRL